MKHFRDILVSWGPLGLLVWSAMESAGIPNPGGTDFMLLALAIALPAKASLCAMAAIVGSMSGSVVFYEITRRGGEKLLARYTSSGRGARFRVWFQRYGLSTVFVSALLPVPIMPFKVFAACAGATGVSRLRYFSTLAAARIPRYFALAYLGVYLGEGSIAWVRGHAWHMAGFAMLLLAAIYFLLRYLDRPRVFE
jgi:membrane protein YqaA with SNARE-associated domain